MNEGDERPTALLIRGEGVSFSPKRVVAVDLEARELVVVAEDRYFSRDFSNLERIPFEEVLWIP